MQISNATEIDVSDAAPPTAVAVTIKIIVTPANGAAFVYSAPQIAPIRFNGPEETKDVPIKGSKIYVQLIQGASDFQIQFLGWTDDL